MLYVTGYNSSIVQSLRILLSPWEDVERVDLELNTNSYDYRFIEKIPALNGGKYFLCHGVIKPKTLLEQDEFELFENITVNMTSTMALCDHILLTDPGARIVVMGSASGIRGSYDSVYAAAKAGLHQYIVNKKLKPNQQLVGVAPTIIEDSKMTQSRDDLDDLKKRELEHPKRRFLRSVEVARLVEFLLYHDLGYITNTIINISGGEVRQ